MNKSSIDFLFVNDPNIEDNKLEDLKSFTDIELVEKFHEGLLSYKERNNILLEINHRNTEIAREQITNLCISYQHSNSKDLEGFLCYLIEHSILDIFMKFQCVMTLQINNFENINYYLLHILDSYLNLEKNNKPSITFYIDVLKYLLTNKEITQEVVNHINWFIKSTQLSQEFIYKTILSITNDNTRKASNTYLEIMYLSFFNNTQDPKFAILSSQFLLQNKTNQNEIEDKILKIAENTNNPYNIRADSCDVLIKLASKNIKNKAKQIINELSKDISTLSKIGNTIYTNKQNVHESTIDEHVKNFIIKLGGIDTIDNQKGDKFTTFEDIVEWINNYIKNTKYSNDINKVISSLMRIKIDQLIYPGSQTLSTIFVKIAIKIQLHNQKELLTTRLIEELIDMEDTCSSGHVARLVNVFSGIDDFNINIGYKKQIQGNISGRLNKLINDIEDENHKYAILEELINTEPSDRIQFLNFFKKHIGNIRNELFQEYVNGNYLKKDEFELFFRQGVSFFETGNKED